MVNWGEPFMSGAEFRRSLAPTNARGLAYRVLTEAATSGRWAGDVLEDALAGAPFSREDRGLARELTLGVVRRQLTLDTVLAKLVSRPRENVEPELWALLQLGVYQLLCMPGLARHAAVHETVELTRSEGRLRWTGFVNGVLRGADRLVSDDRASQPAATTALVAGELRKLTQPVFANPADEPARWLAEAGSMPAWLMDRWLKSASLAEVAARVQWLNEPPDLYARVNLLKTSRSQLLEAWTAAGVQAEAGPLEPAIRIESAPAVAELPGYDNGEFSIQDLAAMQAAILLDPQPGEKVWDVCAAPGSKTCHLAERMKNQGTIVATDIHAGRLRLVSENAQRLGLTSICVQPVTVEAREFPAGPFDRILLDVPCSNTGVLGKRPEARWRITAEGIRELTARQRELFAHAARRLAPGGSLVYSTCSIEPEENDAIVNWGLREFPELRLIEQQIHWPGQPADGAYQALLQRK